jgi:hypothetical protein
VTRDLYRQQVRTAVDITEGGTWLPGKENFLELNYRINAAIDREWPADAQLSTSATMSAELENGDMAVVRADTEITNGTAFLRAEATINNAVVFRKEWNMGRVNRS